MSSDEFENSLPNSAHTNDNDVIVICVRKKKNNRILILKDLIFHVIHTHFTYTQEHATAVYFFSATEFFQLCSKEAFYIPQAIQTLSWVAEFVLRL